MKKERIRKLRDTFAPQDIQAVFITNPSNIFYLTSIDLFLGAERDGFLLVTENQIYLFTDKRYSDAITNPAIQVVEIKAKYDLFAEIGSILHKEHVKMLGFEGKDMLLWEYLELKKSLSGIKLASIKTSVETLRMIKDEEEIEYITQASQLTDKAFEHILPFTKEGVKEYELALELEYFIKKEGADLAFPSIVAFGSHAAIPHHHTGQKALEAADGVILFDFGAKVHNYCADMSRTVFFGNTSPQVQEMYHATRTAQEATLQMMQDQASENLQLSAVHQYAFNIIQNHNFEPFAHGLGHSIGIDVHESPALSPHAEGTLKDNMVVTVEPGIYVPNLAGIRIEDTILYTKKGIRILTISSKDLIKL